MWIDQTRISIQCPVCRTSVNDGITANFGTCSCGLPYTVGDEFVKWGQNMPTDISAGAKIIKYIRSGLDPLSNPYSPFVVWTRWRAERFYQRTLKDENLAMEWADHYLGTLDMPENARVLDHGCGRGRNIALLSQLGYETYGQDISYNEWWHHTGGRFQVVPVDAPYLPWGDESFDLVMDFQVIGHFPREALQNYFAQAYRVLKPGGYLLILEANSDGYGTSFTKRYYGRMYSVHEVEEMLHESGFTLQGRSYEGFRAPLTPRLVDFIRKNCSPGQFDISDYNSWLSFKIQEKKRALWFLRAFKSRLI